MGILDRFKRKPKEVNTLRENINQNSRPFDIKYMVTREGNLLIDFQDMNPDYKQFYDSTRLVLSGKYENISGQPVYDCFISWYGSSDCQMLDKRTGIMESPRAKAYENVLAQIDPNLLVNDQAYCYAVMKGLLNKKRVDRYLEDGMKETPQNPCGNYVGGIMKTQYGYGKFFDRGVGMVAHNSSFMRQKRELKRRRQEERRNKAILEKEKQIARLQDEIDNMR